MSNKKFLERNLHPRTFKRISFSGPKECWNCDSGLKDGYPMVQVEKRKTRLHRFVFELIHEGVAGDVVRHTCDNRRCVNPAHLIDGSILDNVADRQKRNRQAKGEKIHTVKVTEEIVRKIRAEHIRRKVTYKMLGEKYGLCLRQVWMIVTRKNWRHIA